MQLHGQDFEFIPINVFSEEGSNELAKYSPTGKIPTLVDGEVVIWDSSLIAKYLSKDDSFNLAEEKDLTLINEMNDAGIALFQLKKFEIDPDWSSPFAINHVKRVEQILSYFEEYSPRDWNRVAQWLYCTLDWFKFRSVYNWQERTSLVEFMKAHEGRAEVVATTPFV
jgi:glutathione S-transferase